MYEKNLLIIRTCLLTGLVHCGINYRKRKVLNREFRYNINRDREVDLSFVLGPQEAKLSIEFEKEQNQLVIDLATELRQVSVPASHISQT